MSTMKFQTKSVDGKPVICFEKEIAKIPGKQKFDYKSRNQKFTLRDTDQQSFRGKDSYQASEIDSTIGRPTWNAPLKSTHRQSYRQRSQSHERDSISLDKNKEEIFNRNKRKPRRFSDDEETVTLTKSQLAQLLAQTGIRPSQKTESHLNYADEEERRLASPFDNPPDYLDTSSQSMSLSEELARKRQHLSDKKFNSSQSRSKPPVAPPQGRKGNKSQTHFDDPPPPPAKNRRPPAENVMGLIAKLKQEEKQAKNKKPPPPIGGFRGKDQRLLQRKLSAESDEDDELGMNNRKFKSTSNSKQNKAADRGRARHHTEYRDGDATDESDNDTRRDSGYEKSKYNSNGRAETEEEEEDEDPRIDAMMQRVIEENRGKMSEEELVELLSQVYIELKKDFSPEKERRSVKTSDKEAVNGDSNAHNKSEKAAPNNTDQAKSGSLLEKKRQQWEREREELAAMPGGTPWNGPVSANNASRGTSSRASSQHQSTHFNNPALDNKTPSYGRVSQLNQEVLLPRGPTGDENTAMSFGTTMYEARKKEAERQAWLDGLNQQRQEKRTFSNQERDSKRATDVSNNNSQLRDRPF